jgi:putative transposase
LIGSRRSVFVDSLLKVLLGEADIVASVWSKGDHFDNVLAETFSGLCKTKLIHLNGPWRTADHFDWATLNFVDWCNNRRIQRALNCVPLVEFEANCGDSIGAESLPVFETI